MTQPDSRVGGRANDRSPTTATTFPNGATVPDGSASHPRQRKPADRHGMQARVTTVLAEPMRVVYASTTQETARLHVQTQRQ